MSKMRSSGIWSKHMQVSKKENLIQVVKFVLFSASAGIIQALTFTMLNELLHWPYWPCYLIALTLSVLWNFTLNREFTFKSTTNVPKAMLKIAIYYAIFTPLSTWWGVALTNMGWNEYIVLFGTMLINMATEFLVCRFLVYRDSMNTNQRAQRSAAMVQK
jgi:putative flippase GtrA